MAVHAAAAPAVAPQRGGVFSWLLGSLVLFILSLLFNLISQVLQPGQSSCDTRQCTLPPAHKGPLTGPKHYTSSRYGFSLDYSISKVKPSHTTATSIAWDAQLSDGSQVSWPFTGSSAGGRSAQQIVSSTQSARYPDAQLAYTVPDASLGYTMGYGNVYDVTESPAYGQSVHDRLLVFVSIRNGVAVVMLGLGPYQSSSPNTDSHPNPAETPLVGLSDFEENLNSVTWSGQQRF